MLPLFGQLEELNAGAAAGFRPQVVQYRTRFNALPARGSVLSTSRNLEAVSETVSIMTGGDALVAELRTAIEAEGATPVELAVPGPPPAVIKKQAWTRYSWPAAIVGSVFVVLGLTALAAATSRREDLEPAPKKRKSNGRTGRRGRAA